MQTIEKQAYFIDNLGNEQYAIIKFNNSIFLDIDTFNQDNNHTGYMKIYFHPNNRLYLDVIYCYDEFRGAGIATYISELADYLLANYLGYVIRGAYKPGQLSTDRENNILRNAQKLDLNARRFYSKTGYEIIKYDEYLNNKDKYPYLTIRDFILSEEGPTTIVAKPIILKEHSFYEEAGRIYHNNYNKKNRRHV